MIDIRRELQNPNSIVFQKLFAAIMFAFSVQIIQQEVLIEFLRTFLKFEELQTQYNAERKRYLDEQEKIEMIYDSMRQQEPERRIEQREALADKDSINELKIYIETLEENIVITKELIEEDQKQIAKHKQVEQAADNALKAKIEKMAEKLVDAANQKLNPAQQAQFIKNVSAVPISKTLAMVADAYQQKSAQVNTENKDKSQHTPDAKTVAKFVPVALLFKGLMEMQKLAREANEAANKKEEKMVDESSQVADIFALIAANKKKLGSGKLDSTLEKDITYVFENHKPFQEKLRHIEERQKDLADLQGMHKQAMNKLEKLEAEEIKQREQKPIYHHSLFPGKGPNNQSSKSGSTDDEPHPKSKH